MNLLLSTPFVLMASFAAGLSYQAPEGWRGVPSASGMRLAQWELPGDTGAAEAVIFFFGEGGGGGVEANLERWFGQFEQPDGSATKDKADVRKRETNGLQLTIADIRGTYVASVRPGARERNNRPNQRMIAAVVEGPGGPWYIRVLGPAPAVEIWEKSIDEFFGSLKTVSR